VEATTACPASTRVGEDEVPTKEDFDAAVKAALES
jgi:hypothetical protein